MLTLLLLALLLMRPASRKETMEEGGYSRVTVVTREGEWSVEGSKWEREKEAYVGGVGYLRPPGKKIVGRGF